MFPYSIVGLGTLVDFSLRPCTGFTAMPCHDRFIPVTAVLSAPCGSDTLPTEDCRHTKGSLGMWTFETSRLVHGISLYFTQQAFCGRSFCIRFIEWSKLLGPARCLGRQRHLLPGLTTWTQCPESTWWKQRTVLQKLSSDHPRARAPSRSKWIVRRGMLHGSG